VRSSIRIGSGQGFWGDLLTAPRDLVRKGPLDYLVMDYLAEVTMSILQKQKRKDPSLGYARDLVPLLVELLPAIKSGRLKVITNGGGANPLGCRDALFAAARAAGTDGFTVGVVLGDDLLGRIAELASHGTPLKNMETGEGIEAVKERLISANVYFGAGPVAEALAQGAQIVITGRTTDTGLTLAPMMYEFEWPGDDWDRCAAGTVAGHILECGAQSTGGNFSADWRSVPDLAHIGFPVAEAYPDGTVVITKQPGTGGLVSVPTVKEQLLYEIGDPRTYITPDCIADFTTIRLAQEGEHRVRVTDVRGRPATDSYKVSMAYLAGYSSVGTLTYAWPDALAKAQAADRIVRTRLADLGLSFDEIHTEFVGANACHGPLAHPQGELNEVVLRIGVRGSRYEDVDRFGRELAPLVLTGPPGVTGFAGGRPRPSDVVAYWPALIAKSLVHPEIVVESL
jgi:hypothetical protein